MKSRTLSKKDLIRMGPCDLEARLKLFGSKEKLTVEQAFEAGFSVSDICWIMGRLKLSSEIVLFADFCKHDARKSAARAAARAAAWAAWAASDAARASAAWASARAAEKRQKDFLFSIL